MTEQADLQQIMGKARELYAWHLALQEAGFNELMAYGLLQTMLIAREIQLEAD